MTATGWSYATLYETSFCDVQELLAYWGEELPTHVVLNLRYFGERKSGSASTSTPAASAQQAVSQLPQIAQMPGITVRKVSEGTRKLFEYAQGVLNSADSANSA